MRARRHSARIALQRRIHVAVDPGEVSDCLHLVSDRLSVQSENGLEMLDVLAAGELGMEPRADLEQGGQPSPDIDLAGVLHCDPCDELRERRLAGAVCPDDPEELPTLHVEAHVGQGPEAIPVVVAADECAQGVLEAELLAQAIALSHSLAAHSEVGASLAAVEIRRSRQTGSPSCRTRTSPAGA